MSVDLDHFEYCQDDRRPTLGVFTPYHDVSYGFNVKVNCLGNQEGESGCGSYPHHTWEQNTIFDDGFDMCANLTEPECHMMTVSSYTYDCKWDAGACQSLLPRPSNLDGEVITDGSVYVIPNYTLEDHITQVNDRSHFLNNNSILNYNGKNYLFTVDADIRPNITVSDFEVPGSSMVYWDPILDKQNYTLNSAPVEVRMFLYSREKTTLDLNPNDMYSLDLYDYGEILAPTAPTDEVIDSTVAIQGKKYVGISNIFAERDAISFDIENDMRGTILPWIGDDIIGSLYYGYNTGLYVCNLEWGDEEEGSEDDISGFFG